MASQTGAASVTLPVETSKSTSGPAHPISVALITGFRGIVVGGVLGAALFLAVGLFVPSQYTAKASFIPDAGQSAGLLGGLVGQFIGVQTDRLIPRLAGDLAESDPVLTQLLYEHFSLNGRTDTVRLREYLISG